jgi:hypothetical protein
VQDDVRRRDQAPARATSVFCLEVENDRALPAIEWDEVAAEAGGDGHHEMVEPTHARGLVRE